MANLTESRNTKEILCGAMTFTRVREKASGAVLYPGALAAADSNGKLVRASDTAGLTVLGRYEGETNGKGLVRSGVFLYENGSSTEALSIGDVGSVCYVVDDQTVGKAGGTNQIPAGIIRDVFSDGIAVEVGNGSFKYVASHTHAAASSNAN